MRKINKFEKTYVNHTVVDEEEDKELNLSPEEKAKLASLKAKKKGVLEKLNLAIGN
jgi:hypothetical protein